MKLVLMRGLPASGKTTAAKELVAKNHYKRINRDDLRNMIDSGKWSKHNEKLIKGAEGALAKLYLSAGFNVVVDNTHLSDKTVDNWDDFATDLGAKFEVIDFRHVPVSDCIKRDQKRPNYVGEKVIMRMYNEFLAKPPANPDVFPNDKLPECFCFDLDGTLALHNGRSPYDAEKCEGDIVNESVRAVMNGIRQPRNIFLVSGRSEDHRPHTERWLRAKEIEYTKLFMRPSGDTREDSIIKREIYEANFKDKYRIMGWFDDRLRVCREIHNLGLPLFRVGDPESSF
jgi:predicted kinase